MATVKRSLEWFRRNYPTAVPLTTSEKSRIALHAVFPNRYERAMYAMNIRKRRVNPNVGNEGWR